MCLTAYIWTKSRFLGLSLGVHHIGKGQTISFHPSLTPSLIPHILSLTLHTTVHLNLLDYGEEYTVTLPNAYARYLVTHPSKHQPLPPLLSLPLSLRSILTYPWMEMGGKCHLECAQTGYYADIDFHCKVQMYCVAM